MQVSWERVPPNIPKMADGQYSRKKGAVAVGHSSDLSDKKRVKDTR